MGDLYSNYHRPGIKLYQGTVGGGVKAIDASAVTGSDWCTVVNKSEDIMPHNDQMGQLKRYDHYDDYHPPLLENRSEKLNHEHMNHTLLGKRRVPVMPSANFPPPHPTAIRSPDNSAAYRTLGAATTPLLLIQKSHLTPYTSDMDPLRNGFDTRKRAKAEGDRRRNGYVSSVYRQTESGDCFCDDSGVRQFEPNKRPGWWTCMCDDGRARRIGPDVFTPGGLGNRDLATQ